MNNPITVEITINATIEDVWKLWNTPDDIIQWNHPSEDWQTLKVENDLRKGGKFLFRMKARNGSNGFDFCGKYDKVILNELTEYTLDDGRKTVIRFIDNGNVTRIIETFEPEAKTPLEIQKDFCQSVLYNFKKYAEKKNKTEEIMNKEISIEIEKTTSQLMQLISSTNEKQLNEIPFEGSWTIAQVGEHLLKSYGRVGKLENGPVKKTERLPGKEIATIEKIFLDFDSKYTSAEVLLPANGPIEKEKLLSDLQKRILQIKEVIQTKDLTETCVGLPFRGIGELTRLEWIYVILFHTQRHIYQIKNVLKSLEPMVSGEL